MFRENYIKIYTLILLIFHISTSNAIKITPEEAISECRFFHLHFAIRADGTYDATHRSVFKILTEAGRHQFGSERVVYNQDAEDVEILQAYTIIEEEDKSSIERVLAENIEKKPLASSSQGFDQHGQVLVDFPHAAIGNSVYFHYKNIRNKATFPGEFASIIGFSKAILYKHFLLTVESEIPIVLRAHDRGNFFQWESNEDNTYHTVKLVNPFIEGIINEAPSVIMPHSEMNYFELSSFDSFADIGKTLVPAFEAVAGEGLPEMISSISDTAEDKESALDKINAVTSELAERVSYMGYWQTVDGKIKPRSFQLVAETGKGDCKDYATITVALLRRMGLEAYVSLVNRGEVYEDYDSLPTGGRFNHAIVATKIDDEWLFVDPTNVVSMAGNIFPDIANRRALILNPEKVEYAKIPSIDYQKSLQSITSVIHIQPNSDCFVDAHIELAGESALDTMRFGVGTDVSSHTNYVVENYVWPYERDLHELCYTPLGSRFVSRFTVDYKVTFRSIIAVTNLGLGYSYGSDPISDLLVFFKKDDVGSMWLGSPRTIIHDCTIPWDAPVANLESLNLKFNTEWFDWVRTMKYEDGSVRIHDDLAIKNSIITADDLRTDALQEILKILKKKSICTIVLPPVGGE